jgi:hypothetical protein
MLWGMRLSSKWFKEKISHLFQEYEKAIDFFLKEILERWKK